MADIAVDVDDFWTFYREYLKVRFPPMTSATLSHRTVSATGQEVCGLGHMRCVVSLKRRMVQYSGLNWFWPRVCQWVLASQNSKMAVWGMVILQVRSHPMITAMMCSIIPAWETAQMVSPGVWRLRSWLTQVWARVLAAISDSA